MKKNGILIMILLLLGGARELPAAENTDFGVKLRIHAPFADVYEGEQDIFLLRIENQSLKPIPVPDGSGTSKDEFPPAQFRIQTGEEAATGNVPKASPWGKIVEFGNGENGDVLLVKSMLAPGQAMETSSWIFPELSTPAQGGRFRVAMQVGPDDFVYSNWITRTRNAEKVPDMQLVKVVDPPVAGGLKTEFLISEGTQPRYLWALGKGPANTILIRICEVPALISPEIQPDRERGQFIVRFPPGGPPPVYYGSRCGLSRRVPWPKGYRAKDFSLTPLPIRAPSPLEFPVTLFQESEADSGIKHSYIKSGPPVADSTAVGRTGSTATTRWLWLLSGVLVIVIAVAACIIICQRRRAM